ncbi:hypothetical protein CR513_07526, partial [Mucuna pruriens]
MEGVIFFTHRTEPQPLPKKSPDKEKAQRIPIGKEAMDMELLVSFRDKVLDNKLISFAIITLAVAREAN